MSASSTTPAVSNSSDENSDDSDAPPNSPRARAGDRDSFTRRDFMRASAGAAVAATATSGVAAAQDATGDVSAADLAFSSEFVHDPWIPATISVDTHDFSDDMVELDYIDDNGDVSSLTDEGVVLAREPDDDTQPHNPVSYSPADVVDPEYSAFPRGTTYDDDNDTSTDEVPVEWHDPTHWAITNATNGSMNLAEVENDGMRVYSSALADTETVKATLDLSTAGSTDATITEGMSRKFLQAVADVDQLDTNVLVEFAVQDSNGNEVTATADPAGDDTTEQVMYNATGAAQVGQPRVGELESGQSVDLADIQVLEIRISASGGAADADLTLHGFNLERESEWSYGTEEFQTTDEDGNTVVETRDVNTPSGTASITSLSTLTDTAFSSATIKGVTYDAEVVARELPDERVWARVVETPDAYDRPFELETVWEFEGISAYELSVTYESVQDTVELPGSRYLAAEYATGTNDIDEWSDIEDSISWTSKTSTYTGSSPDTDITVKSSVASSDRTPVRHRVQLDEDDVAAATSGSSDGSGAAVAVSSGGGGGLFGGINSAVFGVIATITGFIGWKSGRLPFGGS